MTIEETKFTFYSETDKLKISAIRVEPEKAKDVKGIVQLVHGMCEHKERYLDFMNYLANNGYICVIHDHRGHGESIDEVSDLGYMYEGGKKGLVEDIHELTLMTKEYAEKKTGEMDIPYILLGHSMGSLAVRCYIKKYDRDIDKLVVVGCPSKLPGMVPGHIFIKLLEKIKGDHAHSKVADFLVMNSNYEMKFSKEKLPHAWVNSDKEEVYKYNADPYCNFCFTLNGYDNLVELTKDTYSSKGYALKNPSLPIRFYSGSEDPCAISKKHLGRALGVVKKAGYKNVRAKMYNGMRHEILNEPGKRKVYRDILDFIKK